MQEFSSIDRFGIGWRPELAAGIMTNLEHLDFVEVVADDYFKASKAARSGLRTLSAQTSLMLHGVAMGLASTVAVEESRLNAMARLVDEVQPTLWSEHLAFVRGGGIEIGHLAAPPRTRQSLDGTLANYRRARQVVGTAPVMENIASLVDAPASTMSECDWLAAFVRESGATMLLDLHNLYANAVNLGKEAALLLDQLPLERVAVVHLSGGHWISEPDSGLSPRKRLLDDHVHDVPSEVFELLSILAAKVKQPLSVLIERDGAFPPFDVLLAQLDRARAAVATGRAAS